MEAEERLLHHVLGRLPVTDHDQSEPGEAERVLGVERADRVVRIRVAARGAYVEDLRLHVPETPPRAQGCLPGGVIPAVPVRAAIAAPVSGGRAPSPRRRSAG